MDALAQVARRVCLTNDALAPICDAHTGFAGIAGGTLAGGVAYAGHAAAVVAASVSYHGPELERDIVEVFEESCC